MSAIYKQFATTVVRWFLTIISAWLIRKGIVTEGDMEAWLPEMAAGIVGVLASLGWALWVRVSHRVGFLAALDLPSGSQQSDVKEAVKDLTIKEKVTAALESPKP